MKQELSTEAKENINHWCAGFNIKKAEPNKRNSKEDRAKMLKRWRVEEHQEAIHKNKDDIDLGFA